MVYLPFPFHQFLFEGFPNGFGLKGVRAMIRAGWKTCPNLYLVWSGVDLVFCMDWFVSVDHLSPALSYPHHLSKLVQPSGVATVTMFSH